MPHSHDQHDQHDHAALLPRLLELDAEVHSGYLAEAMEWVGRLTAETQVSRILDVGAGIGTGTLALARRFPEAQVVALDVDQAMLERVRERARTAGLEGRVTMSRADVASGIPASAPFDLVWSASAMHEVSDATAAFANLYSALHSGGMLAVVEMDASPWVLPASMAELERRLRDTGRTAEHPDWARTLAESGFHLLDTRTFNTDLAGDGTGPLGDYATFELHRLVPHASRRLTPSDHDVIDTLLGDGPASLCKRNDIWVRGTRTGWVAQRP